MEIRPIRPEDDKLAVSRIYEQSWRAAYAEILPAEYLASIPAGRWAPHLDRKDLHSLVLTENGVYIGTTSYCASRFTEFDGWGEVVSLYLLPEYMGRGYGRPLLEAAVEALERLGYCDIFLWVLEENHRARRFYERCGFVPSRRFLEDVIGGKAVKEVQYCRHAGTGKSVV